jgi:dihydroxyacid dehydratase/phosphogluconate dehydratase
MALSIKTSSFGNPLVTRGHAHFQHYPALLKVEARQLGATVHVAGGVPAMCDGVTQGPQANGFRVALVTDGRMSGASGKVPSAIHVSPEAAAGGPLAQVKDGDVIRLDATCATLQVLLHAAVWAGRPVVPMPESLRVANSVGMGRNAKSAESGACSWL